jgi:hypothetical protein
MEFTIHYVSHSTINLEKGSRSGSDCCTSNGRLLDYANHIGLFVVEYGNVSINQSIKIKSEIGW